MVAAGLPRPVAHEKSVTNEVPERTYASDDTLRRQLEHYDREGWVSFAHFLSPAELAAARCACDERLAKGGEDPHWLMDVHAGERGAWLTTLLFSPRLRSVLAAFCGSRPVLVSSQFFVKVGGGGRPVGWHQDGVDAVQGDANAANAELHMPGDAPFTLWVPLDDVNAENGGLQVIPRIHKSGWLPMAPVMADEAESGVGLGIDRTILQAIIPHGVVSYALRAGDAASHHQLTPHRSGPNRGVAPRRVLLMRFLPARLAARCTPTHGPLMHLEAWLAKGRPALRCVELLPPSLLPPPPSLPPPPPSLPLPLPPLVESLPAVETELPLLANKVDDVNPNQADEADLAMAGAESANPTAEAAELVPAVLIPNLLEQVEIEHIQNILRQYPSMVPPPQPGGTATQPAMDGRRGGGGDEVQTLSASGELCALTERG
uniref:Uncharacterized protein n=1 Tax=Haptolina brevifila TaxID=156173 RepID=A0A7S2HDB3_9EUKA|mmetsp:Transcript_53479/g.106408  ORF Transcript_53479/g.106408 Transcript_53479/m.106408 type:complete len:432 (+) Transcript_53479:121-1416(+)